jgi:large subunit ribosomal protein L4
MIEVKTFNAQGEAGAPISVSEELFGKRVRKVLLREALLMYETNKRQGNASVLRRSEVQGSTRKLYRQKHTGRARVGDSRSPIRKGGGSVWGPKPRDYSYHLPKKALRAALDSAILAKLIDHEVVVADCRTSDAPKTKPVAAYMRAIGLVAGTSVLYVTLDLDPVFHKSARNIDGLEILPLAQLYAYAVVRPKAVVFSCQAFEKLLEERR